MSHEEEFIRWLNRPEKTFEENLSFALKAWKSSEFTLFTKYEKIIEWFGEKVKLLGKSTTDFQEDLVNEFLQLKCRPGLISLDIKRNFVNEMVEWARNWQNNDSRKPVEVLYKISELEMMQDLFRSEYRVYTNVLGQAFKNYGKYLRGFEEILVGSESEFFGGIMESLKSRAKKVGNVESFERSFTKSATKPLVELIIVFQSKGVKFFNDLLELEKTFFLDYVARNLIRRCLKLPIHVRLVTFECAIVNYRGDVMFYKNLANAVFHEVTEDGVIANPEHLLTYAAYILEMLRKHDISLNFSTNPNETALQFFGVKVAAYVQKFHETHLLKVLNLLCATLRLNPLILEKTVFDITAKMMLAKKGDVEQKIFEEYLLLLMEMFRKLSRAEKFVASLQKSIKELLKTQMVPKKSKRRRTITDTGEGVGGKRLKLKDGEEVNTNSLADHLRFYLDVMFKEFHAANEDAVVGSKISSFSHITFAWPAPSAGVSFSKLIAGLMSKPSLVIWKTLIYAFKDLLTTATVLDDNTLFLFDFYSSLICQYFAGCKLPEQSDKFWKEIEANREITRATLHEFGHFLLAQEHNNRTMNAFLECCYYTGLFDLVLWYYRPDFMADDEEFQKSSKNLHGYLSDDEWVLIQQRIVNFGRVECKYNANRLLIQRLKAKMLFHHKKLVHLHKFMLAPVGADLEQAKLFLNQGESTWLLGHMSANEKQEMCRLLVEELDYESIRHFTEDMDALTTIVFELYKMLGGIFIESKKAILSGIDFDAGVETIAGAVVDKKDGYTVKAIETDKARAILDVMAKLPIGCCRKTDKSLFAVLQLAVYRDLNAAVEEKLAVDAFSILTDMLHFGQPIQVFQHLPLERLVAIVPPSSAAEFYEFIFSTLRYDVDEAEKFLQSVQEILNSNQSELTEDHVTLLLTTIDALNQSTHKKLKRFLESVLTILESHVNAFFAATEDRKSKKDKSFVERTLRGFVVHATAVLTKITDAKDLDENFRRVCKIYIGYSMDCHNAHAIKLIMLALTHRTTLHFDQDEIEFVLNSYWKQLNEDLKTAKLDEKTAEPVIKIIISNKTNEDLLFTLKKIGKDIAKEDFGYICRLLALMAKCPFSTIKGAIFNEHFKLITLDIVLRLGRNEEHKLTDFENVLSLLDCQKAIVENSKIPMSSDTVDDILALLIDINIKRFIVGDTNIKLFNRIHLSMIEVCTGLIKHRHMLLMDRIPHFVHVFKDLVQAICWYKSDRQKDTTLSPEELENLAELAMKLESLMHLMAKHNVELKRVAPYTLTYVINLMVSNARSTTLYPKIKTHIENICYDLVALCDHRVGGFILRCSNEASRQVYETLVKDHKKYHKFKGKV